MGILQARILEWVAISYLGVWGAVTLICDRKVNVKRVRECWKECVGCVWSSHN